MDEIQGAFYTPTTRTAPRPPWFDDLENGDPDWTFLPDTAQGTDLNWSLGTTNNALATSAHSGKGVHAFRAQVRPSTEQALVSVRGVVGRGEDLIRYSCAKPRHPLQSDPVHSYPKVVYKGCTKDAQGMITL
jgi:hypothetical protein